MNAVRRIALAIVLWTVCCGAVSAGVRRVWAIGDGDKVDRDDTIHPGRAGNAVWDGTSIRLFGARNEIVAFQLIVEADGSGIRALSATLPELRSDSDAHPLPRTRPRPIRRRRPSDPALLRPLHARADAVARVLDLGAGIACGAAGPDRMEAGAAGAGERARGPRRISARGCGAAEPGDLDRDLHRARTVPPVPTAGASR